MPAYLLQIKEFAHTKPDVHTIQCEALLHCFPQDLSRRRELLDVQEDILEEGSSV